MMRGLALAVLLALPATAEPWPTACDAGDEVCAAFRAALAAARPDRSPVAATDAQASLRLTVLGQSPRRFVARVDWRDAAGTWRSGRARAALVADSAMTPAMVRGVLDALVRDALAQGAQPPG